MAGLEGAREGAARDAVRVLFAPGSRGTDATAGIIVELAPAGPIVDGTPRDARLERLDATRARLVVDGTAHDVLLLPASDRRGPADGVRRVEVVVDGWRFEVDIEPDWRARLRERATKARGDQARGGPLELRAIIPGRVVSVDVVDGDSVERGQRVLVVEAMKMQNDFKAPRAGTISRVSVGAGQTVELGDLLLVVE